MSSSQTFAVFTMNSLVMYIYFLNIRHDVQIKDIIRYLKTQTVDRSSPHAARPYKVVSSTQSDLSRNRNISVRQTIKSASAPDSRFTNCSTSHGGGGGLSRNGFWCRSDMRWRQSGRGCARKRRRYPPRRHHKSPQ